MITIADFRMRFPEFEDTSEYPDGRIQIFLDDAVCLMGTDENRWCGTCKYDQALAYLVAHLLFVATGSEAGATSANAGPITQKTAGGVSVTRGAATKTRSDGDDFYMSTVYGQRFITLRNSCFAGAVTARFC